MFYSTDTTAEKIADRVLKLLLSVFPEYKRNAARYFESASDFVFMFSNKIFCSIDFIKNKVRANKKGFADFCQLLQQYIGFEALGVQPFFTDISEEALQPKIVHAIIKLIEKNCDTVILAGSYFIGKSKQLHEALTEYSYPDIVLVDPFLLAIRFARLLVDCNLLQSKKIYANPVYDTPVLGYQTITTTPRKISIL